MGLFCVVLWRVWFNRNQFIHGLPGVELGEIVSWAKSYISDYLATNLHPNQDVAQLGRGESGWKLPRMGRYKINTDAAIDKAGGCVGIGIVIRDDQGLVAAASCQRIMATYSPQTAEAVAIYQGLLLAQQTGFFQVESESDAAVVVDWINARKIVDSEVGLILGDIHQMRQSLSFSSVNFVSRKFNCVAHCLAKMALFISQNQFWLEDYPPCIARSLFTDYLVGVSGLRG